MLDLIPLPDARPDTLAYSRLLDLAADSAAVECKMRRFKVRASRVQSRLRVGLGGSYPMRSFVYSAKQSVLRTVGSVRVDDRCF